MSLEDSVMSRPLSSYLSLLLLVLGIFSFWESRLRVNYSCRFRRMIDGNGSNGLMTVYNSSTALIVITMRAEGVASPLPLVRMLSSLVHQLYSVSIAEMGKASHFLFDLDFWTK